MRKILIVVTIAVMAAVGLVVAPQAQAQQTYPSVRDVTQFTQSANYMSLPGYLRYVYHRESGRWISREEAENAVREQLGFVPTASAG